MQEINTWNPAIAMPFMLYYVSAYLICLSWRNFEGDLNLTFGHS